MRACNKNSMRNLKLKDVGRGYYCCMPSSPVLLYISCYVYYFCCMPSIPVLLHIYCSCFSTFWHCHPYIPQHFYTSFTDFSLYTCLNAILFARVQAHPFCCSWSYETHVSSNEEMTFNYIEVLAVLVREGS